MAAATFDMVVGADGRSLRRKWTEGGTRTFLGVHSNGFPNLFVITGPQGGGGSFNFTDSIELHAEYVTWMLGQLRTGGHDRVDVTPEAEDAYAQHCREVDLATAPLRNCLTYYNGYGDAEPGSLAYYGGGLWNRWRTRAQESLEPYLFD
jgi:cation diffusion facilitator CzcD-associated flavoprotein CzcO